MKNLMFLFGVSAAALTGGVLAETKTIDVAADVTTNVASRITGDTVVSVNPGATGGIVTLNPLNTYTGKTTVNAGTLVLEQADVTRGYSSIGTGSLEVGPATIRFAGAAGEKMTAAIETTTTNRASMVFDTQTDLTLAANFTQTAGGFIKKGPATLRIAGEENTLGASTAWTSDTKNPLTFNANGDGPTVGRRSDVIVAEGTLAFDGGVNHLGGGKAAIAVGTQLAEGSKSATLEFNGGTNLLHKPIYMGQHAGYVGSYTDEKPVYRVRVTGGVVSNLTDESLITGSYSGMIKGSAYDNLDTRIEMTGGEFYIGKNILASDTNDVNTVIDLGGDAKMSMSQYIGVGYHGHGGTTTVNLRDEARLETQYLAVSDNLTGSGTTLNVNLLGGTLVSSEATFPRKNKTCQNNIFLDGGSFASASDADNINFTAGYIIFNVRVGTRGFTFKGNEVASGKNIALFRPFNYTNSVPGMERQPLRFLTTKGSIGYYLRKSFSWDGSIYAGPSVYLRALTNDYLCTNGKLTLSGSSRFYAYDANPIPVGALQIGSEENGSSSVLMLLSKGGYLSVTGDVSQVGTSGLSFYLYDSANSRKNPVSTLGTYTVLEADKKYTSLIAGFKSSYSNPPDGTRSYFSLKEVGDKVQLQIVIDPLDDSGTLTLTEGRVEFSGGSSNLVQNLTQNYTLTDVQPVLNLNGGSLCMLGNLYSDVTSRDYCLDLYLNEGSTIWVTGNCGGQSASSPHGRFFANGGVLAPMPTAEIRFFRYWEHAYLGAKGLIIDTGDGDAYYSPSHMNFAQAFETDPALGDEPDGGIRVRGKMNALMSSSYFPNSTFKGDFMVEKGGDAAFSSYSGSGHRIRVEAGAALRVFQDSSTSVMSCHDHLILGTDGDTDPVRLELCSSDPDRFITVSNQLEVLGPVQVAARKGWESTSFDLQSDVAYTALVYRAENATLDVNQFSLHPALDSEQQAVFETVTLEEGDYAGWTALVMTVSDRTERAWTASSFYEDASFDVFMTLRGTTAAFPGVSAVGRDVSLNLPRAASNRNGSGTVTATAESLAGAGLVFARSGRVEFPSFAWLTDAANLKLCMGTVVYTGSGETIPGFVCYQNGTKSGSTLEVIHDLAVNGTISNVSTGSGKGPFIKTGAGTLTLKGTGPYVLGNADAHTTAFSAGDPLYFHYENGDAPQKSVDGFSVAGGRVVIGETGSVTDAPYVLVENYLGIGLPCAKDADCELVVNSGELWSTNILSIGVSHGLTRNPTDRLVLNGGLIRVGKNLNLHLGSNVANTELLVNGGVLNVAGDINVGYGAATNELAVSGDNYAKYVQNGGEVNVGETFILGYNSSAARVPRMTAELNGGVLSVAEYFGLSKNANGTNTVWLNTGAVLECEGIATEVSGSAFYWNGGTYRPRGGVNKASRAEPTFKGQYLVSDGGAIVDTSLTVDAPLAAYYNFAVSLAHDPDAAAIDGGLVKRGKGLLKLTATNTYTGDTVIEDGTLLISKNAAIPGLLVIGRNGVLDCNGGTREIKKVVLEGGNTEPATTNGTLSVKESLSVGMNGTPAIAKVGSLKLCDGATLKVTLNEANENMGRLIVDGNLAGSGTVYVDFGRTDANPIPTKTSFDVLQVTGTTSSTIKFVPVNVGRDCRLVITSDGEVIKGGVESLSGMTIIIR